MTDQTEWEIDKTEWEIDKTELERLRAEMNAAWEAAGAAYAAAFAAEAAYEALAERKAKPDYCRIAALDAARARAWKDRNTRCGCDHNESCAECFPPAFHTGGYWDQQRALLQQSPAQPEGK